MTVINPEGYVASQTSEGSISHPLPGTWVVEFGAQGGCDVMGMISTEVPFDSVSGASQ